AWFGLHEPRSKIPPAQQPLHPGTLQICGALWRSATYRHLALCFAVVLFFTYGMVQWQPTFFTRSYGLNSGALGTWFALIYGIAGIAGTYVGGEWATRHAAHDEPRQLVIMSAGLVCFSVFSAMVYLSPSLHWAFVFVGLAAAGGASI